MGQEQFIISARQPITGQDGLITPYWFRFFESLSNILGNPQFSAQDLALLAQAQPPHAGLATTNDVNDALLLASLPANTTALMTKMSLATMQQQIDDALLLGWIR